jgi:hypothetical protein
MTKPLFCRDGISAFQPIHALILIQEARPHAARGARVHAHTRCHGSREKTLLQAESHIILQVTEMVVASLPNPPVLHMIKLIFGQVRENNDLSPKLLSSMTKEKALLLPAVR